MDTILTTSPDEAARILLAGGIVAFPTETVYGLGANAFNEGEVKRVFEAKQRPADNPLIVHVGSREQIAEVASGLSREALILIDRFFPGPLTVVVEKDPSIPTIVSAGLETIGVRMPRNHLANEFLTLCGVPVAAPSANISGRPSPTTWQAVYEDLNGRIDCILQGELTDIGLESTVVDCTVEGGMVLRQGAVGIDEIRAVLPNVMLLAADAASSQKSPGLRHRHYSPKARVILVGTGEPQTTAGKAAYIGPTRPADEARFELVLTPASPSEYARQVFEFFRECDRRGIDTIYCEEVGERGVGAALMDRIRRAASGSTQG